MATSTWVAERHDPLCGACHLPPEATFVARAAGPEPVDLASAHVVGMADRRVLCVECHGGSGLEGHLARLRMAGADTWAWLAGDYTVLGTRFLPTDRPRHPVRDAICVACHQSAVTAEDFENHYHFLLSDPGAPTDLPCVACHVGHGDTPGKAPFLTDGGVVPACAACHSVMGGPAAPFAGGR